MAHPADGADAIRRAVDRFYERVLADPGLEPWFRTIDIDRLRSHQKSFLLAAIGGPELYQGRDMHMAHDGLGIDAAAFDRTVIHLVLSLRESGVGEDAISRIALQLEPLRRKIVAA